MIDSTNNKKRKKSIVSKGSMGIVFIAIVVLIGFYFYSSGKDESIDDEENVTVVQEVLLRNLDTNYPPSPKEVVRYYCEISQLFYEDISEEDLVNLAKRSRELFDEELLNQQTDEEYLESLREEIAYFKEKGMTISSFALSPSVDVEYSEVNGYSNASLYCIFSLREETSIVVTEELFILREDEDNHWKIYGFTLTKDEE